MSTVLKVVFLLFVCFVAVELQAYATSIFGASQATEAALANFNGHSSDHGTFVTAMTRFWAGNIGIAVMWLGIATFAVVMFWNEITSLVRLVMNKE
jgi:hypothetical protein